VPEELPKTGSPYLLIALAGLSSLGIFGLLRAIRSQ
jgi:LPXTG-motif cell wall-anchored protein